ncbi:MAG: hypothetical protein L3J49_05935 [Desulfobulbaceae bacterium]|nr:hypothetical protein [Desulfobulbaceae bacterium]
MKSSVLLFSFVTACSLLTAGVGFCAGSTPPWDITGLTPVKDCSFPAMHGTTLVWQAKGGLAGAVSGDSDWEIFLYDMDNQAIVQITDDDDNDIEPQTDGEYVVWQKYNKIQGNQIFIYRVYDGNPAGGSLISPAGEAENSIPKIAGGRVVWTAHPVTNSYEAGQVMLYNAADQSGPMVISEPGVDCSGPRIDARQVVWMQHISEGTEAQYVYDLFVPGTAKPAPDVFICNRSTSVDGSLKVLTRHDGTDREVILYNRMDGFVQITDNALADHQPIINQNHIAWLADGDIYLSDIAEFIHVQVPDVAGGRGTAFSAFWSELSGGVDAYFLDVSTDPDFQSFVEGFRGLDVGTASQYRVDGLSRDTTYYYRVSAQVNGSTTAQSKSVTVKLTAPRPSSGCNCTTLPFVYKLLLK